MKSNNFIKNFLMNEVNESKVAIKLQNNESIIFQLDEESVNRVQCEIDPQVTPIITENVPFTNKPIHVSKLYIASNILLNACYLILIVVILMTQSQLGKALMIAIAVSGYLVYLVMAYHFSNLLPLASLMSVHEYRPIYEKLTSAKCHLKFKYTSARNNIDEPAKNYEQSYQKIKVVDRSGVLYNLQKNYAVIFVKYHKKFYYCDQLFKNKVYQDFNDFVQKCKKEHGSNDKKCLLRGKEKIELLIEGMIHEMGYFVHEDHCYKFIFYLTLFLGLAAYYQLFMRGRVLRYEMDILKEVCPQEPQQRQ